MSKHKAATQAVCNDRVNVITDLILSKMRRGEIIEYLAKEHPDWKISVRQMDNYISKAAKAIKALSVYERNEKVGEAIGDLHLLFKKMMRREDLRGALLVRKEINDLLGLKEAVRVVIDSKNLNANIEVTQDDLNKLIADLEFVAKDKK